MKRRLSIGLLSAILLMNPVTAHCETPSQAQTTAWRNAANRGDAAAQFNLGVMYATGLGVVKNEAEAVIWYRKAALQGLAKAQYNLAMMYEKGDGVGKDKRIAKEWFKKGCEQGLRQACDALEKLKKEGN